ncbi:MAG: CvpA family protein [Oscillospiraceae bacterium]|nr:CvpA family protein [Oscillospiraceae bacterium]
MEQLLTSAPLAADIAAATVIFCCVVLRGGRGLSRTLLPMAATIVAAAGAIALTAIYRERVTELVYPWLREQILGRMDLSTIRSRVFEEISSQLQKLLPDLLSRYASWLELDVEAFVAQALKDAPFSTGQRIAEEAVSALLRPVSEELVSSGLLLLLFIILRLALGALAAVSGLVPELPIIGFFDRLLGALVGALECAVVFWLLCHVLKVLGFAPALQVLEQTRILSKFL